MDGLSIRQLTMTKVVPLNKRVRNKRVTVDIDPHIDDIREKIKEETGVTMTYVQVFDFLIHFYIKHCNEPRTKWMPMTKK
jgi:hypothetical protein